MCGQAGILSPKKNKDQTLARAKSCLDIQAHRGPDHSALSSLDINNFFISLTHNRLSIIDLKAQSNQPFWSQDKQHAIIFNGEIYNYLELRQDLKLDGVTFQTDSDTEVLLQALIHYPLSTALNKFNGMWSFAFIDIKKEKIIFSRDRFGKKPFYYFHNVQTNEFIWSSEIKYILAAAQQKFNVNPIAVSDYIEQFLLEADPEQTFFSEIKKLPAGSYCEVDLKHDRLEFKPQSYYQFSFFPYTSSLADAVHELDYLLKDAVRLRLRSDVELGFLLSGGLDSSTITGIGAELSQDPSSLKTLSIVSDNKLYDESPFIELVEKRLGLSSYKINVEKSAVEIFDLLSTVQWFNDEPLTSFSAVTYYLMMAQAKSKNVKVLLSGQGADEVFCGYRKYMAFYFKELLRQTQPLQALSLATAFLKTQPLANTLDVSEIKRYVTFLRAGQKSILTPEMQNLPRKSIGLGKSSVAERQLLDVVSTSVPALLHYEDRLSMAHSREVRAPFLDYRIVEFGLNLPTKYKINDGWSKFVVRKVSEKYVPQAVSWRKDKKGFSIPQEEWFRTTLKNNIEQIFNSDALMYQLNLIDKKALQSKFQLYCAGGSQARRISFKEIFTPLALEIWLKRFERNIQ